MKDYHENCRAPTVGCTADSAHCAEPGPLQSVGAISQYFDVYYNDEHLGSERQQTMKRKEDEAYSSRKLKCEERPKFVGDFKPTNFNADSPRVIRSDNVGFAGFHM